VSGDRVIVRGEVTGTPAGELFGVPHIAQIIVDKGDELNSLISGGGCGHEATMLPRTAKALPCGAFRSQRTLSKRHSALTGSCAR
jgi:hypothetical protein